MNNGTTMKLFAIFICTVMQMDASMESESSPRRRKVRLMGTQTVWKTLNNFRDRTSDEIPVRALSLNHIDFVQAVLIKLEEDQFPMVPQEKNSLLNTPELTLLASYCDAHHNDNNAMRTQIQTHLNQISPNDQTRFRHSSFTYFEILGSHNT